MSLVGDGEAGNLIIVSREEVLVVRVAQISNNDAAPGNEHVILGVGVQVDAAHDAARETDGVVELYLVARGDLLGAGGCS